MKILSGFVSGAAWLALAGRFHSRISFAVGAALRRDLNRAGSPSSRGIKPLLQCVGGIFFRCVLFGLAGGLYAAAPAVRITEAEYEGRAQFKIETAGAIWFYDRAGGGFSRLIDADGRDWISFHKTPLKESPAGAAAGFRGMPNLVFGKDNPEAGAGHPGFDQCESVVVGTDTIRTATKSGRWAWTWRFDAGRATLTVDKTDGDRPWWFLYEGPIAGRWAPGEHTWGTNLGGPNRTTPDRSTLREAIGRWRWVYFGDRSSPRVLFVAQVEADEVDDVYYYMGSTKEGLRAPDGMVVFGFGRTGAKPLMRGAGARFVVGFVETPVADEPGHARVAAQIEGALGRQPGR